MEKRLADGFAGKARAQVAVAADQPQTRPLGQPEGEGHSDEPDGYEDEEDRRKGGAECSCAGFARHLPDAGPVDGLVGPRLGPDDVAVELSQTDRDRGPEYERGRLAGADRMELKGDDEREPDDRPVDDPGDVWRVEMAPDGALQARLARGHSLLVVAGNDPDHGDLLARLGVRVDNVHIGAPAEPAGLSSLPNENGSPLRPVSLLDPDLLTLLKGLHGNESSRAAHRWSRVQTRRSRATLVPWATTSGRRQFASSVGDSLHCRPSSSRAKRFQRRCGAAIAMARCCSCECAETATSTAMWPSASGRLMAPGKSHQARAEEAG